MKYEEQLKKNDKVETNVESKTENKECVEQASELVAKCMLTCIVFEGHEKPIQKEMYERHTDATITSNIVLRPESYKDLLKVTILLVSVTKLTLYSFKQCRNLIRFHRYFL